MSESVLKLGYFNEWLAWGERGISSNAIVYQLIGSKGDRWSRPGSDHPFDPSDFRRCEQLLEQHPFARPLLGRMSERSPEWAALVKHWDEIAALLKKEMTERKDGKAPATYAAMKAVLAEASA